MSPLVWVLITAVALVVLVVAAWLLDRRDHRRHLERGAACDPEGMRATGDAWRSMAGDRPPTLQVWSSRAGAAIGPVPVHSTDCPSVAPAGPEARPLSSPRRTSTEGGPSFLPGQLPTSQGSPGSPGSTTST